MEDIFANNANVMSLIAKNISVTDLFAQETTSPVISTAWIKGDLDELKLSSGNSISMLVEDTEKITTAMEIKADGVHISDPGQPNTSELLLQSDGLSIIDPNGETAATFQDAGMTSPEVRSERLKSGRLVRASIADDLVCDYWEAN